VRNVRKADGAAVVLSCRKALSAQSPGEGNVRSLRAGTQFPRPITFTNFNAQFLELCIKVGK